MSKLSFHASLTSFFLYRSLHHLAAMVKTRLEAIPRSLAVRYWHRAVLGLFGYLCYELL